jgi:hypothetical protein
MLYIILYYYMLDYFRFFKIIMRCVCLWFPSMHFQMSEHISMKLGITVMAPEAISAAYVRNLSHQSVCLYVYPSVIVG